jgi:hypothetical protein
MDILADLRAWLAQLVNDAPHRAGELPSEEINLVSRAIEEIERLRAALSDMAQRVELSWVRRDLALESDVEAVGAAKKLLDPEAP